MNFLSYLMFLLILSENTEKNDRKFIFLMWFFIFCIIMKKEKNNKGVLMKIVIPEYKTLEVDTLFLDMNGTIAVDGVIPASVRERLSALGETFRIYVLTADTHGNAKEQCEGLPVILETFPTGNARDYKKELIKATGARRCIAVGNGRNDELMLKEAALSIAVLDKEGAYGKLLKTADLCVRSMQDALDLLLYPSRIVAGLRG